MQKTVWERCFIKTKEDRLISGQVQERPFGRSAKITRTHNIYQEQNGDPVTIVYFEFSCEDPQPPDDFPISNPPERMKTQEEAQACSKRFTESHEHSGWTIDPVCTIDDWD